MDNSRIEDFITRTEDFRLVSFDIFNTLLLRMTEKPEDIFERSGETLQEDGYLAEWVTSFAFQQIRKAAERACIKERSGLLNKEYSLKDIYAKIPDTILSDSEAGVRAEIEAEKDNSYLNPDIYMIIKRLHDAGKQVYLTSDMYLSSDQISEILEADGFNLSLIDGIVVSSEYGVRKITGELFNKLAKLSGRKAEEIIHFGDDLQGDVNGAQRVGVTGVLYDIFTVLPPEMFIEKKLGYGNGSVYSMRLLCNDRLSQGDVGFWYRQGCLIWGAVLASYAEWLLDLAGKKHIKNIYPLMREGVLIEKLVQLGAGIRGDDINCKRLYASRRTTAITLYDSFCRELFQYGLIQPGMTVRGLYSFLGIDWSASRFDENDELKTIAEKGMSDSLYEELCRHKEEIDGIINNKKDQLYGYLNDDFSIDEDFITADIGFYGTICTAIDKAIKRGGAEGKAIHALMAASEPATDNVVNGSSIIGFLHQYTADKDALGKYCEFSESLMMGDEGSTAGYRQIDGHYHPILQDTVVPEDEIRIRSEFQDGVLDFARLYFTARSKREKAKPRGSELINILYRLYNCPLRDEARNYTGLKYEQNIAEKAFLTEDRRSEYSAEAGKMGIERFRVWAERGHVSWPEAAITITDPTYLLHHQLQCKKSVDMYTRGMLLICEDLKNSRVEEVIVYGAGDVGVIFGELLGIYRIRIRRYIDRDAGLRYKKMPGDAMVGTLEELGNDMDIPFCIASLSHIDEITESIRCRCKDVTVFHV